MEEITEETAELVTRVAGLDIGKASLVCCVRVPQVRGRAGRRPTGWMRCGWPGWPSRAWSARHSSRRRGSGNCGICAATGAP